MDRVKVEPESGRCGKSRLLPLLAVLLYFVGSMSFILAEGQQEPIARARYRVFGDNYDYEFTFDVSGMVQTVTRIHPDPFGPGTLTGRSSVEDGDLQTKGNPSKQHLTLFETGAGLEVFQHLLIEDGEVYLYDFERWNKLEILEGAFP